MTPFTVPHLRSALSGLPRDPLHPGGYPDRREAAVALVLRGEPMDVLFIKRSESPRDPWSGQMALPGGRLEEVDPDLRATAMRETQEETGLILQGAATYLGHLPTLAPITRRIPAVAVSPHVFLAEHGAEAGPVSHEVASTHWISLDTLRAGSALSEVEITFPEGVRRFPCFRVDGQVIWGLTFRIMEDFLRLL